MSKAPVTVVVAVVGLFSSLGAHAFRLAPGAAPARPRAGQLPRVVRLSGKGFGNTPKAPVPKQKAVKTSTPKSLNAPATTKEADHAAATSEEAVISSSSSSSGVPSGDDEASVAAPAASQAEIFAKYGVRAADDKRSAKQVEPEPEPPAFEPLSLVPPGAQLALERFLLGGIVVLLLAFLGIGVGITVEAFAVSTEQPLPEDVRHLIVDILEPNFTPILFAGFACSISLGALKALQLSSDSGQYREE